MRYLIDGYNLLHALGLARRNGGRAAWDRARQTMLDWLAEHTGDAAGQVTVLFDAQNSLGGVIEESHRGLRVIRDRGRTADDLIEDLLREERSPESLAVVSNDGRVRDAARRRGVRTLRCSEYVDALLESRRAGSKSKAECPDEKAESPSPTEKAEWLQKFGE